MRPILFLVGSGVLVLSAGAALGQRSQATVNTVPLELQSPSRYDVRCELQPVRELTIVAPQSGIIREVTPHLGDQVRTIGQLVRLDSKLQEIAVNRAAAQVKAAEAELEALSEQSASASALAKAQAQVAIAQANKEEADFWLSRTTVSAPISGQVTALMVYEGQYAVAGQALMTLTDYDNVVVWMPWDAGAKRGGRVKLSIEQQVHDGEIKAVMPLIPAHRHLLPLRGRLATVVIEIDNKQNTLRPGQRVACPLLPSGPLTRVNNDYIRSNGTVQVLRGNVVRNIDVRKHSAPDRKHTVVSGAFLEGDELITSTTRAVRDGTRIDPKNVRRSS
jgi:multidrug efflux pump subunit AcrA (membrane-fusion protein)